MIHFYRENTGRVILIIKLIVSRFSGGSKKIYKTYRRPLLESTRFENQLFPVQFRVVVVNCVSAVVVFVSRASAPCYVIAPIIY